MIGTPGETRTPGEIHTHVLGGALNEYEYMNTASEPSAPVLCCCDDAWTEELMHKSSNGGEYLQIHSIRVNVLRNCGTCLK